MPIYEFACQDCGHEFEKIQSFSDSSTPACPNCQGVHVQRRLSAPAIHFKGSGWYITDSKKAAKGSVTGSPAGGDESKGEGKGDGKGDGKGESGAKNGEPKSDAGKAESSKSESGKTESSPTPAAGNAE
jgi:putative FmdB family regulatory protein